MDINLSFTIYDLSLNITSIIIFNDKYFNLNILLFAILNFKENRK